MKRMSLVWAVLACVAMAAPVRAEMVTACWGNAGSAQHPKTVKLGGDKLSFDLSALPKDAKVYAARLFMSPVPWTGPGFDLVAGDQPIKLVGPCFQWYDASAAAAAWVKGGGGWLQVRKGPKVDPDAVVLEIAYEGKPAGELPKQASDVKALYRSGQVFITFKEIEPLDGGKDEVSWADLAGKFKGDFYGPVRNPKAARQITYRVYTHDQPITPASIGQAHLVAEVLPGSAFNTRFSLQVDAARKTRQMVAEGRGPNDLVLRSAVEPGKPVEPGAGLHVHTVAKEGKAYYAVLTAVNGVVNAAEISPANAVGPIDQKPGEPEPVMYKEFTAPVGVANYVEQWYSFWTEQPLSPWPARYDVVVWSCPEITAKPAPLYVIRVDWNCWIIPPRPHKTTSIYMSLMGDMPVEFRTGLNDAMGTQKGFDGGKFQTFYPNRQVALVRWMLAKWPVDKNRVSSELGSWGQQEIKHGDVYAYIVGGGLPELTKGWQSWQRAVGIWGKPEMYQGRPDDENPYVVSNLTDWVLAHPKEKLPFTWSAAPGGHETEIGWAQTPRFIWALQETKHPCLYDYSRQSPVARAITSGQLPIRMDQSLPAFNHCSLDDNLGEGCLGSGTRSGQVNGYLLWDPASIVDEPASWQMTIWLDASAIPFDDCTVDLTPRYYQKFKAAPGAKFAWANTLIEEPPPPGAAAEKVAKDPAKAGKPVATAPATAPAKPAISKLIQSGTATADANGFVTIQKLGVTKGKHRIEIKAQ